MANIYIVESIGEILCCTKSIKKAREELLKLDPNIDSLSTISRNLRNDNVYAFALSGMDSYKIYKTFLV